MGVKLNIFTGQLDFTGGSGGGGTVASVNGQTGVVVLDAADIPYDNTASGLSATDVQAAIDELEASIPAAGANTSLSNLTSTSINQDLIPNANGTLDIGAGGTAYANVYTSGLLVDTIQTLSAGDLTISGAANVNVSGAAITNVLDPVNPQDAATKAYVDNNTPVITPTFPDNTFRIQDNGDLTKQIAFEASGITTATTRTITMPNANVDLGALANTSLSNLSSVAFNTNLLPGTNGNRNLGSDAFNLNETHARRYVGHLDTTTQSFILGGDNTSPSGATNRSQLITFDAAGLTVSTVNRTGSTVSSPINIETGNTVNGNSGNISLRVGVPSGSGTKGFINVNSALVKNGVDPVDPQDLATKAYVDASSPSIDPEFSDADFRIQHDSDLTKQLALDVSAISTATTRTITMPDVNIDLNNIPSLVTLSGVAANSTDLGTFTGTIIPDNSDIKEALQELETSINSLPNPITYQGVWNASTNTPTLSNSDTGVTGHLYQVTVAGTVDFGAGNISFNIGDKVVNNGTTWDKWDMTDAVTSVNGLTGDVILDTDDIAEGANLYFTDERAQDAAGLLATNSSKISLTYNDATPSLIADVVAGSLVNADINASAGIVYSKLSLSNSIVDADINASAAIAINKLAALTVNRALVSDASGVVSVSATTDTEIGYVSGVTSSIQAQLNSKTGYSISSQTTSFSASAGITYLVDTTGGAVTVTLPSPVNNTFLIIKDTGNAAVNNIIISGGTIDGTSGLTVTSPYASVTLVANGSVWYKV